MVTYIAFLALLFVLELCYFKIAEHFNIIDKPNERSSHKMIVLRGGGVIFTIALWIWSIMYGFPYPWLLAGVTLAAGVSFWDDNQSLPDRVRLIAQFASILFVYWDMGLFMPIEYSWYMYALIVFVALIIGIGAMNFFNFMDGINGITGGYSLAMLIPLYILNQRYEFVDDSLLIIIGLSLFVFCFFNFRTKAKCFAGDVGSIGIAMILVFVVGRLMLKTGDMSWLILFLLYGADGCMTIAHRIMLHENLGEAHRKHAFQLMSNELGMKHVVVSSIYMVLQLAISLVAIYIIPDTPIAHWTYFIVMCIIMALSYIMFMKKYYHLHEEYLQTVNSEK